MAHEALKFNVLVSNTENWQPIVGSKDHETFYMVYIKFNKVEEIDSKFHYSAEFKLQNYQGSISMGFVNIPRLEELTKSDKLQNKKLLELEIERIEKKTGRKFTNQERIDFFEMHRIDFLLDIPVKPFCNLFHIPSSKLNGVSKPLEGNVLESTCNLKSPNYELYDSNDPLNSVYINPYHYQRAGDEIIEIGKRNLGETGGFQSINTAGTILSNCNPSRSYLI